MSECVSDHIVRVNYRTFYNLQSNVISVEFVPMLLVAMITTVYVVLEVVLKLQFIVSLVT